VKRLVWILLAATACSSATKAPETAPARMTGAAAPRTAVEQFLQAVRAEDLQAMGEIWGNAKGPARDQFERSELEKREIMMQGCFDHDKFRILDEAPGEGGQRVYRVELTKQNVVATPRFYAIQGPGGRWYVSDAEITAARDICRLKS
jgi:hypothetical protein